MFVICLGQSVLFTTWLTYAGLVAIFYSQKINVYYWIMYLELFATRQCGRIVLYYQLQQDVPVIEFTG